MRRIKLNLLPGLEVEFADRDGALRQVEDWAREGTRWPIVVFGPEGCGKSAFLWQAFVMLRDLGYDVIYVDPLHRFFTAHTDVDEIARRLADAASETIGVAQLKLATLAIDAVKELLARWGRRRVAVLVDEVFQAIGVDKAGIYVKSLLNLIEYPPRSYEGIVAAVATGEGVTRWEIGRHSWAHLTPMWNMAKEGFRQLYDKISRPKPPFEEVWRWTGGNPNLLLELYMRSWSVDAVVKALIRDKELTSSFIAKWRGWLEEAVEDPRGLVEPRRPRRVDQTADGEEPYSIQHVRQRPLFLGRPAPTRERPGAGHREKRGLADADT